MVNLFDMVATEPKEMMENPLPISDQCWSYILDAIGKSTKVVACWGNHGSHKGRAEFIAERLTEKEIPLWCLGTTKLENPLHPSRIGYDRPLLPFNEIAKQQAG